jgi:hypothetical protein
MAPCHRWEQITKVMKTPEPLKTRGHRFLPSHVAKNEDDFDVSNELYTIVHARDGGQFHETHENLR